MHAIDPLEQLELYRHWSIEQLELYAGGMQWLSKVQTNMVM